MRGKVTSKFDERCSENIVNKKLNTYYFCKQTTKLGFGLGTYCICFLEVMRRQTT